MVESNNNISEKNNKGKIFIPSEQEKLLEPSVPKDYWLYILIGLTVCSINIFINRYIVDTYTSGDNWEVTLPGYLIIIFLIVFPTVIIGTIKRPRGYGYVFGYILGGLIEVIRPEGAQYIGFYTIWVSVMLLIIIYGGYYIWRSVSKVKFE